MSLWDDGCSGSGQGDQPCIRLDARVVDYRDHHRKRRRAAAESSEARQALGLVARATFLQRDGRRWTIRVTSRGDTVGRPEA